VESETLASWVTERSEPESKSFTRLAADVVKRAVASISISIRDASDLDLMFDLR
jgi:hypothetical protein